MRKKADNAHGGDLAGCEVLLCVCGGIAAYKVASLVSSLVQRGAGVTVAMTEAATRFVGPVTLQALSGRAVITGLWTVPHADDVQHIRATERADLVVVAPATANIIGKMASGVADEIVSTLLMSAAPPVLFAPAMNERMWANPIVQKNVKALKELGHVFLGPGEGWQACRHVGKGRMVEPDEILTAVVGRLAEARG
ncbi:MAG: phosphopantothenoylcysteine decarboxylase [Phycisphaerales bacterium]|nr:MAG: phosphopantothenoylcysteine decarboxylase [Phycisphaerales bacterium]